MAKPYLARSAALQPYLGNFASVFSIVLAFGFEPITAGFLSLVINVVWVKL